ncbi:MAG: electron transfer flavoprotein subunit beta/FixA family protein [Acidimicrobiia bacterium]|nr:electron transfer flavoprotein subunit beta/FixA family protein [Acidimicrobiia bacterium]
MRILVCVKRVPAPGARIVLTEDRQAIDTNMLGFTISPHEECAVEEAVRIVEEHGGSTTVLTLGPIEADEQLRTAVSVGADEAVLLATDVPDWDPMATAAAIVTAIGQLESGAPFDLILFGNESADSGGYQVGIRVARALGRPMVSGIKGIDIGDGSITARRATPTGSEVYELPLPAVVAVREGINLPRYPTLKGRMAAKKAETTIIEPAYMAGGQSRVELVTPPQSGSTVEILGTGPDATPAVVDILEELGLV